MRDYLQDQYSPLAHIPELARDNRTRAVGVPSWVEDLDARRLTAYRVLSAYRDNNRRFWLPDSQQVGTVTRNGGDVTVEAPAADQVREYGDPGLLVDTARGLLLGDDQTVEYPEDTKGPFKEWLDAWVIKERLTQKLLEGEENTIGDGDGVYVIGWSASKQRPTLRVFDPGFYFPDEQTVVPGWGDDEFPPIVHLAWEWVDQSGVTWIRRQTWRMEHIVSTTAPWGGRREWTCWYRSVDYRAADRLPNTSVYSPELTRTAARTILTDGDTNGWVDMAVDFIPVVHVPNDASTQRMFGKSLLLRVAQILDDVANNDTDLASASQQVAPAVVTTGVAAGGLEGGPGAQWGMPTGSSAAFMDTSKNLTALLSFDAHLLERMCINTRLSPSLLGMIKPNEVPSGYALQLGFAPAKQLLREMRTVRDEKYPLILRFAMRLAQAAGVLEGGPTPAATIALGASLPADLPTSIAAVKDLLPVHGISTATAVRILKTAGMPIDDAVAEVKAIQSEWFEQAVKLVEATGDTAAARALLGLPAKDASTLGTVTPPAIIG